MCECTESLDPERGQIPWSQSYIQLRKDKWALGIKLSNYLQEQCILLTLEPSLRGNFYSLFDFYLSGLEEMA